MVRRDHRADRHVRGSEPPDENARKAGPCGRVHPCFVSRRALNKWHAGRAKVHGLADTRCPPQDKVEIWKCPSYATAFGLGELSRHDGSSYIAQDPTELDERDTGKTPRHHQGD